MVLKLAENSAFVDQYSICKQICLGYTIVFSNFKTKPDWTYSKHAFFYVRTYVRNVLLKISPSQKESNKCWIIICVRIQYVRFHLMVHVCTKLHKSLKYLCTSALKVFDNNKMIYFLKILPRKFYKKYINSTNSHI